MKHHENALNWPYLQLICKLVVRIRVPYVTPLCKNVLPSSDKISGVEADFGLCCHKLPFRYHRLSVLVFTIHVDLYQTTALVFLIKNSDGSCQLKPHLIIQVISHDGFWTSGPFSTFLEVLLDQRSVGSVLKEAGPPRHRSLYNLISHNQEDVSGHGSIHAYKTYYQHEFQKLSKNSCEVVITAGLVCCALYLLR